MMDFPSGCYLIAVSGGADSTALLRLAAAAGCAGAVAHLNHQLRGDESDAEEIFVRDLAKSLSLPIVCEKLADVLPRLRDVPGNDSAKYRAARLELFRTVIAAYQLDGVLLAHHADDQAEGVMLRLLRGAQLPALGGMETRAVVEGVTIIRPLLGVRRAALRDYLQSIHQPWREDSSNASAMYRRNAVRQFLAGQPGMTPDMTPDITPDITAVLLHLAQSAAAWRSVLDDRAPVLPEAFDCAALRGPAVLAEHAAGRWLIERGAPPDEVSPAARQRLIDQALNPAASPRQHYPGGILVRRRKKRIDVIPAPAIRRAALQSTDQHGQDQTAPAGEL